MAIVGWIAAGMTVSKGIKRTPPLPPAPTDMCFQSSVVNSSDWMTTTSMLSANVTSDTSDFLEAMKPYVTLSKTPLYIKQKFFVAENRRYALGIHKMCFCFERTS